VRARALVSLALAIAAGAALAAPVGVLEVTDGRKSDVRPLDDREAFIYSYIQSVYNVPVVEEQVRDDGLLRIVRVRSSDIKAVEYFRWDGPIRQDETGYVQDAPRYEVAQLLIRITAPNDQTIRTSRWSIELPSRFGETVVTVRPLWLPRAIALLRSR
jgi:hypothetical protein